MSHIDPKVASYIYEKDRQIQKKLKTQRDELIKAGNDTSFIDEKIKKISPKISICAYYAFDEH